VIAEARVVFVDELLDDLGLESSKPTVKDGPTASLVGKAPLVSPA
jgi:hypothetical protein